MELLNQMTHRRSCRIFNDTPLTNQQIETIVKAALLSPTGHGYYPCELIVVTDKEVLQKLEPTRVGGGKVIANSSCAIFVIGDTVKSDTWIEDCSIMLSNMHLMADAMGLGSCWIQARNRQSADGQTSDNFVRSILNYPENYQLEGCLAIGNIDNHPDPHDDAFLEKMSLKVHNNIY